MRKLLSFVILWFVLIGAAHGAVGLVQQTPAVSTGSVSSATVTFDSLPSANSTLVVVFGSYKLTDVDWACTDNQSPANTYTRAVRIRDGAATNVVFYVQKPAVNQSTFSITVSGTTSYYSAVGFELSGVGTIDVNATAGGTNSPTRSVTASGPTAKADEILIALSADTNTTSSRAWSIDTAGWTQSNLNAKGSMSTQAANAAYRIITAIETPTIQWTHTSHTGSYANSMVGFSGTTAKKNLLLIGAGD